MGCGHRPFGLFSESFPSFREASVTQSGECPNPGEDSTVTAIVGSCITAPVPRTESVTFCGQRERVDVW